MVQHVPFKLTTELPEKMDNETTLLIIPINRQCPFRDSLFNRDRLPAWISLYFA